MSLSSSIPVTAVCGPGRSWHRVAKRWLPGLRRAGPSAPLDERYSVIAPPRIECGFPTGQLLNKRQVSEHAARESAGANDNRSNRLCGEGVCVNIHANGLLRERTWQAADWPAADVLAAKQRAGVSIAVVLPALNEADTVGTIVDTVRSELMSNSGQPGLVDDLVVIDSASQDATAQVARTAGARVIARHEILPDVPVVTGKGDAMWRALAVVDADIIVFCDADLRSFTPEYVTGLVGPLLVNDTLQLVKAVYERPLTDGELASPYGGGRVTELVARPLLNLGWPELVGVIQPLAGEYAARRSLLETLSFPVGYGVEFAILVDTAKQHGVDAIGQVDLGVRIHRHHGDDRLGRMSAEIMRTAWRRSAAGKTNNGPVRMGTSLTQFQATVDGFDPTEYEISELEHPPMSELTSTP